MTIFRVERITTNSGMWYQMDQTPDNIIAAMGVDAPMPFNPEYRRDGLVWLCAVHALPDLNAFLPEKTLRAMHQNGFRLYQLEVNKMRDLDWHPVFSIDHIQSKIELPFDLLLPQETANDHA